MGRSAASTSLGDDAGRSLEAWDDICLPDHSPGRWASPGITPKRCGGRRAPHGAARAVPQKKVNISRYRSFYYIGVRHRAAEPSVQADVKCGS